MCDSSSSHSTLSHNELLVVTCGHVVRQHALVVYPRQYVVSQLLLACAAKADLVENLFKSNGTNSRCTFSNDWDILEIPLINTRRITSHMN